jgi:hypothetical protein
VATTVTSAVSEMLAICLAAYVMPTMTMFGSSEEDGHFHWCAEVLRRPGRAGRALIACPGRSLS